MLRRARHVVDLEAAIVIAGFRFRFDVADIGFCDPHARRQFGRFRLPVKFGRKLLRETVRTMKERGRTVLLVSHVLTEVEQLCDRAAVLSKGRLVHVGPLGELTAGGRSLESALQELYDKWVGGTMPDLTVKGVYR